MTTESRRAALQALVNAVTYAPIGELKGGAGRGYMAIVPEQFILDAQAALDSVAAPVAKSGFYCDNHARASSVVGAECSECFRDRLKPMPQQEVVERGVISKEYIERLISDCDGQPIWAIAEYVADAINGSALPQQRVWTRDGLVELLNKSFGDFGKQADALIAAGAIKVES